MDQHTSHYVQNLMKTDIYKSVAGSYQNAYCVDHVTLGFIDRALSYLPPQAHILDMGCGTGNPVAMALVAAGHKVKGVDKSPSMVDLIRKNVPSGTFETGDMFSYEHPQEEPLDAVFNVRALFHPLRKPNEECVRSWGRWLPKGGHLCMVVLTADDYNQAKVEKYDEDGHFAKVTRRFMGTDGVHTLPTRLGLKHLLHENGLEILDERMEVYTPPKEIGSDEARQYCFIARKT